MCGIETYLQSNLPPVFVSPLPHFHASYVEEREEFLIRLTLYYCRNREFYNYEASILAMCKKTFKVAKRSNL